MEDRFIVGIDESGTGAWAACFCVGGVVLPADQTIDGVKDSKKLSDKRRRALARGIYDLSMFTDVGYVYPKDIREKGQALAWQDGVMSVVHNLVEDMREHAVPLEQVEVIIDGKLNKRMVTRVFNRWPELSVRMEAKADENHCAVSAASIIAKTARNDALLELHEQFPEYGFNRNYGYGTEDHAMALSVFGRTKHHRPLTDDWPLPERRD